MPKVTLQAMRRIVPRVEEQLPPLTVPQNINQLVMIRDSNRFYDWKALAMPRGVNVFFESHFYKPASRNITAYKACLVTVTGPLGTIRRRIVGDIAIIQDGQFCHHTASYRNGFERKSQCLTSAKYIKNMIYGVSAGWEKRVRLYGKGFRAQIDENDKRKLILRCGYARPVLLTAPHGISFQVLPNDDLGYPISIRGIDLNQVGAVAGALRKVRKVNLQGQGIRYYQELRKTKTKKGKR